MTRKMVVEIERYGGRPAATLEAAWEKIAGQIEADLQQETAKYLVAESVCGQRIGHAAARIVTLDGAFEPRRTVHISVVYVVPASRQAGVACRLVAKAVE